MISVTLKVFLCTLPTRPQSYQKHNMFRNQPEDSELPDKWTSHFYHIQVHNSFSIQITTAIYMEYYFLPFFFSVQTDKIEYTNFFQILHSVINNFEKIGNYSRFLFCSAYIVYLQHSSPPKVAQIFRYFVFQIWHKNCGLKNSAKIKPFIFHR